MSLGNPDNVEGPQESTDNDLARKREYNRQSAARARKRHKDLVTELQEELARAKNRLEDLVQENNNLKAKLKVIQEKNTQLLLQNRLEQTPSLNSPSNMLSIQQLLALQGFLNRTE